MSTPQVIYNGVAGICGSVLGVISPLQTEIEWWIRIVAGLLGIVVTVLTVYRLLTNKSKS